MFKKLTAVIFGVTAVYLNAECPNACSSHGKCSAYDMCLCYRNWMANDCSERICQFGLAHVDSPKGDLDASANELTGPDDLVVVNSEMYPWGTQEQFPAMTDSNGTTLSETGHYYMECSNKGICDRSSGTCECFPGYEGSACQRASCPSNEHGTCSGHGTCEDIRELANLDYGNVYELWDKHASMGCYCDAGYYGPDCSQRRCKYGSDPLYYDDSIATRRYANWTYGFLTQNATAELVGNYSIHFYDVYGEEWETEYLDANATCADIISRFEELPNDVVPKNSVLCLVQDSMRFTPATSTNIKFWTSAFNYYLFNEYTIVFTGNPGVLKQPWIDIYLDGSRPTLASDNEVISTLKPYIYADGFHGEFVDYVSDYCEGVVVTLEQVSSSYTKFGTLSEASTKALKKCLGDSDGDTTTFLDDTGSTDNQDVYDWDYGTVEFPHLIKLVQKDPRLESRICNSSTIYDPLYDKYGWCSYKEPAGFYAALRYDGGDFVLMSNPAKDYDTFKTTFADAEVQFYVFTTTGTLSQRGVDQSINTFSLKGFHSNVVYTTEGTNTGESLDCESRDDTDDTDCIEKGDLVMLLNADTDSNNDDYRYPNLYTVEKINIGRTRVAYEPRTEITLNMGVNVPDSLTNFYFYKFTPGSSVSWAAECSDRGICDDSTGLCDCFNGYTSDDCSVQNALAL